MSSEEQAWDIHKSVLLDEVLEALQPEPGVGFVALDCNTGAGGHSHALLERSSPDGRLYGLDADADALSIASRRLAPFGNRAQLIHGNFRELRDIAEREGIRQVSAVVFDLGLSSAQLERSGRGFSFRPDEPLDMRFDAESEGETAADVLNSRSEVELERMFRDYGEEPRARRLAGAVVRRRSREPFARTGDFVAAVTQALGPQRGQRVHPATKPFQALRIAVNDELGALEEGLSAAVDLLRPGGRIAVISFHSLEDRVVKWRFREWADTNGEGGPAPKLSILTKKPITPREEELAANPRARSAKLRVAERLPGGAAE